MEEGADEEQKITFADLPPSVQQAILRMTTKQAIEETTREMENGIIVYGVEYADGQRAMSADFDASGKLLELEQEDEESDDEENDHD